MLIKGIQDEDFVNYKKPSMFISFPNCTWKCDRECGMQVCQNNTLATAKNIDINIESMVKRYIDNNITSAIVMGGLEPLDSFADLIELIAQFRQVTNDDIVIYTGYYKEEIQNYIEILEVIPNITMKFGRFIPNHEKHYDEVLGVWLASDNQYGEKIS